jgi:hypothetical protein
VIETSGNLNAILIERVYLGHPRSSQIAGSSSAVTIPAPENIMPLILCSLLKFARFLFSKKMLF